MIIKEKPMKRHEYREMKFWKSLTNNDYGIVAPLDQKKMANLIECMKGKKRTVERYAYDCKISTTAIYIFCGRKRLRIFALV